MWITLKTLKSIKQVSWTHLLTCTIFLLLFNQGVLTRCVLSLESKRRSGEACGCSLIYVCNERGLNWVWIPQREQLPPSGHFKDTAAWSPSAAEGEEGRCLTSNSEPGQGCFSLTNVSHNTWLLFRKDLITTAKRNTRTISPSAKIYTTTTCVKKMPAERHMNLFYAALSIFSQTTSKSRWTQIHFNLMQQLTSREFSCPSFLSTMLLSAAMQVSVGITSVVYLLFFFFYFLACELEP